MKTGDTAAVFHCTFGALPEVHFLHSIYHFKAQKVKNPTIQTIYDLELKWGRYSLRKTTASSWGTISHDGKQGANSSVQSMGISHTSNQSAKLELQRAKIGYFFRLFFFWYFLCLNFHFLLVFNYSCNSLARKYPRKGKITFLYKFSCNHWKIIFSGSFLQETNYCKFDT